jgi:hypothetical protein
MSMQLVLGYHRAAKKKTGCGVREPWMALVRLACSGAANPVVVLKKIQSSQI